MEIKPVNLSRYYLDKEDRVSYSYSGPKLRRFRSKSTNCYSSIVYTGIITDDGEMTVICRPYQERNSTPPLPFQRFFRELTRTGLIPEEVVLKTFSKQNALVIPYKGWGYHPLFVTLSLYRHADQHGKSILGRTMLLYNRLRKHGTHFLQCLHWSLAHTDYYPHHSCFNIRAAPKEGAYRQDRNTPLTLKHGIAIAKYGQLSLAEKRELPGSDSTAMFRSLATDLRDIEIKVLDDILDPKFGRYYENPELARK